MGRDFFVIGSLKTEFFVVGSLDKFFSCWFVGRDFFVVVVGCVNFFPWGWGAETIRGYPLYPSTPKYNANDPIYLLQLRTKAVELPLLFLRRM